jgi:hypothetical protein
MANSTGEKRMENGEWNVVPTLPYSLFATRYSPVKTNG